MILQDGITLQYSHNCYININKSWLWCSDLLKGSFLLADFMLRLDWVAGDGSRDFRSKAVLVRFGILDWLIFCCFEEREQEMCCMHCETMMVCRWQSIYVWLSGLCDINVLEADLGAGGVLHVRRDGELSSPCAERESLRWRLWCHSH